MQHLLLACFGESGEQVAGFEAIACTDPDEAVAVAVPHPSGCTGKIEVRQVCNDELCGSASHA